MSKLGSRGIRLAKGNKRGETSHEEGHSQRGGQASKAAERRKHWKQERRKYAPLANMGVLMRENDWIAEFSGRQEHERATRRSMLT